MPFAFQCPFCGDSSQQDDAAAGHDKACSTCGQTSTVVPPVRVSPNASRSRSAAGVVAALVVAAVVTLAAAGGLAFWLLMPVIKTQVATNHRAQCHNNLKQVALALHNYHDAFGSFPPAYVADDKGVPLYSWRVLILPYLNEKSVYQKFNLNEAWDSPTNILLSGSMPKVYGCPENPDPSAIAAGETSYMVVVGSQTMFPGAECVRMDQVSDGVANTILVVETTAVGVNWMSPTDLSIDSMTGQINTSSKELGSHHGKGGANVAMADASIHFVPERTRSRTLYNSLTRNGGESSNVVTASE